MPTLAGLYCAGAEMGAELGVLPAPAELPAPPPAFAPSKANGERLGVAPWPCCCARLRMNQPMAIITPSANRPNIRMLPKASPMPSECASQAKPKPAAKPPSMAPHGFFGATAGAAAGAAGLAAFCAAPPAGAASFCVTLLDCLPTDFPPPRRLAASALKPETASVAARIRPQIFIVPPKLLL